LEQEHPEVRHEITRNPIVGVVQEDFQYFPDFLCAQDVKDMGAVAYRVLEASYTNWVSWKVKRD
jgi:hypothetical protein